MVEGDRTTCIVFCPGVNMCLLVFAAAHASPSTVHVHVALNAREVDMPHSRGSLASAVLVSLGRPPQRLLFTSSKTLNDGALQGFVKEEPNKTIVDGLLLPFTSPALAACL